MPDLLTLGDQPLLALVSPSLLARLEEMATRVRYRDGVMIHGLGDDKPGLSIVRDGAVRFAKHTPGGGEVTVSILGPGHSFGEATLFAGMGRAYDAIAVGDTMVDQISKAKFDRILQAEPELAHTLLAATTRRLYSVLAFLDDLRTLPLGARVAKLIIGMVAVAKTPDVVECRQSDLAFTLGVSRVSVGKALARLQDKRAIQLGYGRIEILSRAALAKEAAG